MREIIATAIIVLVAVIVGYILALGRNTTSE